MSRTGKDFNYYSTPRFNFWFDGKYYTEQGASTMFRMGTKDDISTMRSEYTRMRDVAQKRIKRLRKMFPESKTYIEHKEGFAKLRDLDERDFPKAFAELARFLRAKLSSVTGQRHAQEKTTETLNKAVGAGSDKGNGTPQEAVTKANYWRVVKILNRVRQLKIARVYGSDKIVELAETTLGLSSDQFDSVLDNLESFLNATEEGTLISDLEVYMAENNIQDYQMIDMDDFRDKMGYAD